MLGKITIFYSQSKLMAMKIPKQVEHLWAM